MCSFSISCFYTFKRCSRSSIFVLSSFQDVSRLIPKKNEGSHTPALTVPFSCSQLEFCQLNHQLYRHLLHAHSIRKLKLGLLFWGEGGGVGCVCGMQKFPGQESNLYHSSDPCHLSDSTRSLPCCTTREHLVLVILLLWINHQVILPWFPYP